MDGDANLVRAVRGPITLITLGLLFTLDHFTPYTFNQTWPVLLIVYGLLSVLRRGLSQPPGPPPPGAQPWAPPPPGAQPWAPPPPAGKQWPTTASSTGSSYPSSGGYRQSPYGNTGQPGGSTPGSGSGGTR